MTEARRHILPYVPKNYSSNINRQTGSLEEIVIYGAAQQETTTSQNIHLSDLEHVDLARGRCVIPRRFPFDDPLWLVVQKFVPVQVTEEPVSSFASKCRSLYSLFPNFFRTPSQTACYEFNCFPSVFSHFQPLRPSHPA